MKEILKIIKFIFIIFIILFLYVTFLKVFPDFGKNIDNATGINFNSSLIDKFNKISNYFGGIKDDTDNYIDSIGTNSKNKSEKLQDNINEIQNN